jgi:hypothetical protein
MKTKTKKTKIPILETGPISLEEVPPQIGTLWKIIVNPKSIKIIELPIVGKTWRGDFVICEDRGFMGMRYLWPMRPNPKPDDNCQLSYEAILESLRLIFVSMDATCPAGWFKSCERIFKAVR